LRTHLAECPRCQAWQQAWATLERAIDQSSAVPVGQESLRPPHTLADRVVAELQTGSSRAVRRGLEDATTRPARVTGEVSVRRAASGGRVRLLAVASVFLALGSVWLIRPSSTEVVRVKAPGTVELTSQPAPWEPSETGQPDSQPESSPGAGNLGIENLVASGSGPETGMGAGADWAAPRPPIVKPLVGMVHNLTSLVLPGWPSVFNDSVGIPHYFDGENSAPETAATSVPPLPAPLELVQRTEVSWPEPVEELLAVATESVQTMWDLANRW
jgi:hypothetical protein